MTFRRKKPSERASRPQARQGRDGPRKVRTARKKAAGASPARRPRGIRAPVADEASADDVIIEPRAKGKLGEALRRAQGETVSSAMAGGQNPIECEVFINGELAGIYKAQAPDKLERAIKFFMAQSQLEGTVEVKPLPKEEPAVEVQAVSEPAEQAGNPQNVAPAAVPEPVAIDRPAIPSSTPPTAENAVPDEPAAPVPHASAPA